MPLGRFQVIGTGIDWPARDNVVNTLYFNISAISLELGTDWKKLCEDIAQAYQTHASSGLIAGFPRLRVVAYDMGDAKPRYPKHTHERAWPAATLSSPREVALCLSYYADQNRPRRRGRIYLGPPGSAGARPSSAYRLAAVNLGQALGDIGGSNVTWRLFSPTTGDHHRITNVWCDDEWDTVRSRGQRSTTRSELAISN